MWQLLQSTVLELAAVHTLVDENVLRHNASGVGGIDVENAVLIQELMALKVSGNVGIGCVQQVLAVSARVL